MRASVSGSIEIAKLKPQSQKSGLQNDFALNISCKTSIFEKAYLLKPFLLENLMFSKRSLGG